MGRPTVVVVGSINVDLVVTAPRLPGPGETVSDGSFARYGGGKGANQAVAAVRAGAAVRMVGAVGDDELGREALEDLAGEGVEVSGVARLAEHPTGVALIVVDRGGENQIAVAPGANRALEARWVEETFRPEGTPGVLLTNFEIPDEAVLAAARRAAGAGWQVVCNPAPARELPEGLAELGPILTPNRGEAAALTGEEEPARAARWLAERTGAPAVVTLGTEGAVAAREEELLGLPAFAVRPVDTTGAGDAFNGVLAAGLAAGLALEPALRRAMAAGALATTRPGARTGPTAEELEAFLTTAEGAS